MHACLGVCTHTTLIILTWGPFYGSRQKLESKQYTIPKLTVAKNCINSPQQRMHRPSLLTTEREPCLKKGILFGISVKGWSGFLSLSLSLHFWYLFPEELYANAKHLKNTVQYWMDACKKVNHSFAPTPTPCLGSIRNQQRRFQRALKAIENPDASFGPSWDLMWRSHFYFLGHISMVPSQVCPKTLTEGRRPSEAVIHTQPRASCVWIERSSRLPKFNPDQECLVSPLALPHIGQVVTSEKITGKASRNPWESHLTLLIFHSGRDLGTKLSPEKCKQTKIFSEKGATNPISAVKCTPLASLL